jgi:hypothetical protein
MESRLPKAFGVALLLLLAFSFPFAVPAHAQVVPPNSMPLWVTINASAQGNYPGGDELFIVFVVNSAPMLTENETIDNMTLTAPFASNFGAGLPSTLLPGQTLLLTIHLEIPSNFSQKSFTANLIVHARLWNGTGNRGITLTGTAPVNVLSLPSQSTSQTTSQTTSQPAAQSGTISTTLFAAGVAIPSLIVIVLLILLVRGRAGPK